MIILNVKLFDDYLVIATDGLSQHYVDIVNDIILKNYNKTYRKDDIMLNEKEQFYNILSLLNEHFTLLII